MGTPDSVSIHLAIIVASLRENNIYCWAALKLRMPVADLVVCHAELGCLVF